MSSPGGAELPVRDAQRETQQERAGELALVDAEAPAPEPPHELMSREEAQDLERLQRDQSRAAVLGASSTLTLSKANVARAHQVRVAFEQATEDDDVGAHLLEELAAGETAVALELEDVEAGLVSLLGRTMTNPSLSGAVAKTLREVVAVADAIRRRMQNSLSAAENLRAQRRFVRAQRG